MFFCLFYGTCLTKVSIHKHKQVMSCPVKRYTITFKIHPSMLWEAGKQTYCVHYKCEEEGCTLLMQIYNATWHTKNRIIQCTFVSNFETIAQNQQCAGQISRFHPKYPHQQEVVPALVRGIDWSCTSFSELVSLFFLNQARAFFQNSKSEFWAFLNLWSIGIKNVWTPECHNS